MVKEWKPAFELNLDTAGTNAFEEIRKAFYERSAKLGPIPPIGFQNGWHTVTPELAEDFLRRTGIQRKVALQTVKKYYHAMKSGGWHRTGQPLIINREGKAEDLQHRCWAAYLGNVSFDSYIITDAPVEQDLFAFIDDCRPRTAGDALHTSGMNGLSTMLAGAIKLAWRYDNNALTILKNHKIRDMSIPEVIAYGRENPGLNAAAHQVMGTYAKAATVVGNKPVAVFFAWKVLERHDDTVLDDFMVPLGSGANLAEDSPILALRNRLLREAEEDGTLNQPRRLALVIKAFNLHIAGKRVTGRGGLYVRDNEKFPRLDDVQPDLQTAAE